MKMKPAVRVFLSCSITVATVTGLLACLKMKNEEIKSLRENQRVAKKKEQNNLVITQVLAHMIWGIWSNGNIKRVLESLGYKKIAVYGYGYLGEILMEALLKANVDVVYVIDRNSAVTCGQIPVYMPGQTLPDADVIIVTITYDFDEIKQNLLRHGIRTDILSLETIIYQM